MAGPVTTEATAPLVVETSPIAPAAGAIWIPPRFCIECGTRLAVVVTPTGFVGRCKTHGEVARS